MTSSSDGIEFGLCPGGYRFGGLQAVSWATPAVAAISQAVEHRDARRVFIVTSPSLMRASNAPEEARASLGEKCVGVFSELAPHTPAPQVDALVELMRERGVDLVVTFGGGTPIDTVKIALAMLATGAEKALDLVGKLPWKSLPPVRQIAVPTTLSGAEFSDLAGLTDTERKIKHSVSGPGIGPAEVILDPWLTLKTPIDLWMSTGLRAIDHAVETLCSVAPTPYTDALAEAALARLSSALRRTRRDPDDLDARMSAQQAVWMASSGLDRTPFGASHGIGHQLGAVAGVPHGICSCVLLPSVLDWNASVNPERQWLVAKALDAKSAAAGVRALLADLGLPTRLRDVGVPVECLPEIAASSLNNRWVKTNPRAIRQPSDVLAILEAAW